MSLTAPQPLPAKQACPEIDCNGSVSWDSIKCSVCLRSVEAPNIRWAKSERDALDERYAAARNDLADRGAAAIGDAYEAAAATSVAVFASSLAYSLTLLDERQNHQNYHKGVNSNARSAAAPENDAMRLGVDARLYGNIGAKITMAALSLSPVGLPSYGQVFMQFSERACGKRASVLSENSFPFVARYGDIASQPRGLRATWEDRARLALVVAANMLTTSTSVQDFPGIMMAAGADRGGDRFMEVHLYDDWNIDSLVGMTMLKSSIASKLAEAQAEELRDLLIKRGMKWTVLA